MAVVYHTGDRRRPGCLGNYDTAQDGAWSTLPAIQQATWQAVWEMDSKQLAAFVQRLNDLYARMTPAQKAMVDDIRQRLGASDAGPRGLGTFASALSSIVQAGTAIASVALAYEGLKDQKEAREAQEKAIRAEQAARAEALRVQAEQQAAALQLERERLAADQRLLEQQPASAPSGGTSKALLYGGAAAAGIAAVLLMR